MTGDTELHTGIKDDLPFLRISLRSAMGLRIERQLNRLRVKFPDVVEFDRAPAQATAVARGMGWGVTTPLCLLEKPDVLDGLKIMPITRGAFSRQFDLLAREDTLGEIPRELALEARRIFAGRMCTGFFMIRCLGWKRNLNGKMKRFRIIFRLWSRKH